MINEKVLTEKMKYLISGNSQRQFEIINIYIEFEYTDSSREKLENYDIDIKFDYHGALDFDIYSFAHDIQRMSEKLRDILNEYVITQEGKIIYGKDSNCYSSEPSIYEMEYKVDETHIFNLGYKFNYQED